MQILILEDNDVQANLLSKTLYRNFKDVEIVICDDIESARQEAKCRKSNLFLLDVEIRDGNSIDFAQLLTEEDSNNCNRIIFITAHKNMQLVQ